MRSTQEWEAALEGVSAWPWKADGRVVLDAGDWSIFVDDDGCEAGTESLVDSRITSLAPEAVAEVVRLRRELEELRRDMRHQPSNNLASEVGNAITIILEGTNE